MLLSFLITEIILWLKKMITYENLRADHNDNYNDNNHNDNNNNHNNNHRTTTALLSVDEQLL